MAEKFYSLITKIGKAKIANSIGFGDKINFTKMKVGDGGGSYYEPTEEQTDLKNTVWEGNINHVERDKDNPSWIHIELMIPATVGGFTIREYGAFDDEGNLIGICKCAETYKPVITDGSTKELLLDLILCVVNTENIQLKIDPTIIFAKKSDLELLENKINNLDGKAVTLRSYNKLEKDTKIIPIGIPEFNHFNEDDLEVHMNGRLLTKDVNYKIAPSNTEIENIDEEILWQAGDEFDIALHKNIKNKVEHIDVGLLPKGSITEDKLNPQIVEKVNKLGEDIKNIDLSADKVNLSGVTGITSNNVKGAIQELFQFANNGKQNWVDVIGSPLVNADTFSTLKSKTQSLKNTMASNLRSKGQNVSGNESLNSLVNRITSIQDKRFASGALTGSYETYTISGLGFYPNFLYIYYADDTWYDRYIDKDGFINKYFKLFIRPEFLPGDYYMSYNFGIELGYNEYSEESTCRLTKNLLPRLSTYTYTIPHTSGVRSSMRFIAIE